jgi:ribose transport system permease protein
MTRTQNSESNPGGRAFGAAVTTVWHGTRRYRPVLALLIIVVVYFGFTEPVFLTSTNIQNIFSATSVVWIIAMGMTLVLISGGLDLSVAAIASLAGICLAKFLEAGLPGWLAVIITIILGALLGGITNGVLIGPLKLSVFVVTLATLTSFTGIVNIWSGTQSTYVTDPIVSLLAIQSYFGIVAPIWVMAIVFLVVAYLQSRTYFGRDVFAIGGSMQAARLSGIRPGRTIIGVYALVAGCAALAGIIAVGRTGAVVPQVDNTLPLQAIAAVLLGGTSLTGGLGGVGGTAIGVIFLGALQNGLSLNGVSSFWQQIVTGVILVAAVLLDRLKRPGLSLFRRRRTDTPASVPAAAEKETAEVVP